MKILRVSKLIGLKMAYYCFILWCLIVGETGLFSQVNKSFEFLPIPVWSLSVSFAVFMLGCWHMQSLYIISKFIFFHLYFSFAYVFSVCKFKIFISSNVWVLFHLGFWVFSWLQISSLLKVIKNFATAFFYYFYGFFKKFLHLVNWVTYNLL